MTHEENIIESRIKQLVPDDKLDRQMRMARKRDMDSQKAIFDRQTENGISLQEKHKNIQSSIY